MKTGASFHVRRCRFWWVGGMCSMVLAWPVTLLADPALLIGLVGGAVVGSWVGADKWRGATSPVVGTVAAGPYSQTSGGPVEDPQRYRVSRPVTLTPAYLPPNSTECRQVETQGFVNGKQETLMGLACRSGQGGWQYQETPRIAHRTVIYPQGAPLPDAVAIDPDASQGVMVYPVPRTVEAGPFSVVVSPPETAAAPYGGRYYGHRDYWRERYHKTLDR